MENLFAQRAAITLQMKEIEERLQWLDEEIDRVESEPDGRSAPPSCQPLTQHPEELLTDPTMDDIEDMEEISASGQDQVESRRISKSPAGSTIDMTSDSNCKKKQAASHNNPFGDLWSANERNQFEQNFKASSKESAAAKRNNGTLENYFVRPQPPVNTALNPPLNQQYPWTQRLYHHLHKTFSISSFRDHQLSIINATLSNRDVFVIMRTGGGKSLTYQLPAILEMESDKKITVVIAPLISLIQDQEEQMNQMYPGSATSFTSGIGREEHAARWARVRDVNGRVALVFVTPEKVGKSGRFKGEMEKLWKDGRLGRFVIGKYDIILFCISGITDLKAY